MAIYLNLYLYIYDVISSFLVEIHFIIIFLLFFNNFGIEKLYDKSIFLVHDKFK